MRTIALTCLLTVLTAVSPTPAGEPRLIRETVLPGGATHYEGSLPPGEARLSPDGEHLYLAREAKGRPGTGAAYQVVLGHLKKSKEKIVPIPLLYHRQAGMVANPFSADGKLLVVSAAIDADGDGEFDMGKEKVQPALYDVTSGKLDRLDVEGDQLLATFDASGKHLIIAASQGKQPPKLYVTPADRIQLKPLKVFGMPLASSPTGTTLALLKFPVPPKGGRTVQKFVLYDFAKDSQIAELPTHDLTWSLRVCMPQWTADGRYLYYGDEREPIAKRSRRGRHYTRVWDTRQKKEVAQVSGFVPVGACGGSTTMVLMKKSAVRDPLEFGAFLHDAATGKVAAIAAEAPIRPISTTGRHLLYVRKGEAGRKPLVLYRVLLCRAEIQAGSK